MEAIAELFNSAPLPYQFITVPDLDAEPVHRDKKLKLYVNKVITKLSVEGFTRCGFEETTSEMQWNASWGRQFVVPRYASVKSWQKINHFAGAFMIGRKDEFHRRMTELKERVGDFASFYQDSYLMPAQKAELEKDFKNHRLWIVKPFAAAQGKGIYLVDSSQSEIPTEQGIVQVYVERPFLITGRKFDIRLYALVTSVSPVRIYMHDSGLIRFATHKYDPNAPLTDLHTHLTNFSLNKDDEEFVRCGEDLEESIEDSKWSIPFFIKYLKDNGIDSDALFKELDRVCTAAILAGMSTIQTHHQRYVKHRHSSFEQLGIDVLLDENLHPTIVEINVSPAMSGMDSKLDYQIKSRLMHDVLSMARIIDCDCSVRDACPGIDSVERECNLSVNRTRNLSVKGHKSKAWDDPVFADYMIVRDFVEEKVIMKRTGYRRVFPKRKTLEEFIPCFGQLSYSDVVLTDWVRLSNDQRLAVLQPNFDKYSAKLAEFQNEM